MVIEARLIGEAAASELQSFQAILDRSERRIKPHVETNVCLYVCESSAAHTKLCAYRVDFFVFLRL